MELLADLQTLVYVLATVAAFLFHSFTFSNAMRYRSAAYSSAGTKGKGFWIGILGVAMLVGFLGIASPLGIGIVGASPLSLFGIGAIVASGVYMANVRKRLGPLQGKKPPRRTNSGGW